MKSETYLKKANELKKKRENLKVCPRNAKKIAELEKEEKNLRAKARDKKTEEKRKTELEKNNNPISKSFVATKRTPSKRQKVSSTANPEKQSFESKVKCESEQDEDTLRLNNKNLKSELEILAQKLNKGLILISKLKSKILNSELEDKSILEEMPAPPSKQLNDFSISLSNVRETNVKYKELIESRNEALNAHENFIDKLQSVTDKIEGEPGKKFFSSKHEYGETKILEEKRANASYKCNKCYKSIVKGSQYICVTIHGTGKQRIPNKLYGG